MRYRHGCGPPPEQIDVLRQAMAASLQAREQCAG
jgi:hypothetical protein